MQIEETSPAVETRDPAKPYASGWSPDMDRQLLAIRGQGLRWSVVAVFTPDGQRMSERRCQKRYQLLTSTAPRPQANVARIPAQASDDADRDGLDWLIQKGRLGGPRLAAAQAYRRAFRNAGDLSVKSCLDVIEGGRGAQPGQYAEVGVMSLAWARRDLFALRWVVLGGQTDMLTAMDGVCGVGHTLRALTGETKESRVVSRAAALEAVLMVALDLVARHLAAREQQASVS